MKGACLCRNNAANASARLPASPASPPPAHNPLSAVSSAHRELHARRQPVGRARVHATLVFAGREAVKARLLEPVEGAALRELLGPSVAEGDALVRAQRDAFVRDVLARVEVDDVVLQIQAREELLLLVGELRRARLDLGPRGAADEHDDERETGDSEAEHHRDLSWRTGLL